MINDEKAITDEDKVEPLFCRYYETNKNITPSFQPEDLVELKKTYEGVSFLCKEEFFFVKKCGLYGYWDNSDTTDENLVDSYEYCLVERTNFIDFKDNDDETEIVRACDLELILYEE